MPGYLLSQWALSEHAGHLRVASTDAWAARRAEHVTVLRERGKRLAEVGRVSGLGPASRSTACASSATPATS